MFVGGPTSGTSACKVTYGTNTWNSGFTANVTVANTGSSAINGWNLGFTLPSGQSITSSWNAALTGSSGAVTARNVSFNGAIPPGGSTSFGFQATHSGSTAAPIPSRRASSVSHASATPAGSDGSGSRACSWPSGAGR